MLSAYLLKQAEIFWKQKNAVLDFFSLSLNVYDCMESILF